MSRVTLCLKSKWKNELEEPLKAVSEKQNFRQWVKHAWLYSDQPQAFKERIVTNCRCSAKGTLISPSAVPEYGCMDVFCISFRIGRKAGRIGVVDASPLKEKLKVTHS